MPAGAFAKISDLIAERPARRAHRDRGERADPGVEDHRAGPARDAVGDDRGRHEAVTIRVNDVEGVAGFVLPGDRVDVALTRQRDKSAAPPTWCCRTCGARDRPDRRRARRQAVDRAGGHARSRRRRRRRSSRWPPSVGTLSLMLRRAGEATRANTRRITLGDLPNGQCAGRRTDIAVRDHRRAARAASATTSACRSRMRTSQSARPRGGRWPLTRGRDGVSGKLKMGGEFKSDQGDRGRHAAGQRLLQSGGQEQPGGELASAARARRLLATLAGDRGGDIGLAGVAARGRRRRRRSALLADQRRQADRLA